ncbi:LysR substrate-binding domain-containing protein, partial [Cochlodiniinecator piscidefendens]|uniref:LysR substrate-binding domain-containing protein n=1 Tax=Cochlodiniinecator piscidefendens TaxID=2715756 RepID=UPI001E555E3E
HGDWTDGTITHLGHEYAIVVCHPDYVKTHGAAFNIQTVAQKQVVAITGSETDWARLSDLYDLDLTTPSEVYRVDSSLIALNAVITGKGAVIVLESFARLYLNQGLLVSPFAYQLPIQSSHFLIQREGTERREEVQLFSQWVRKLYFG